MPGMKMVCPCVGGQHHAHRAAVDAGWLVHGAKVELVREPSNPYDENAIKVLVVHEAGSNTPMQIGYIAKNFAADLSHHMDKGMKVTGNVALIRANSCMINVEEVEDGQEKA